MESWPAVSSSNFLPTELPPNPIWLAQCWPSRQLAFPLAVRNACPIAHPTGPSPFRLPPLPEIWTFDDTSLPVRVLCRELLSLVTLRARKKCWQTFAPKGESRLPFCNSQQFFAAVLMPISHELLLFTFVRVVW